MARLTTDPNDPELQRGIDQEPSSQSKAYLILSEEERAKGFVRPVRDSYQHVGIVGPDPSNTTQPLTEEQKTLYASQEYVLYEKYPEGSHAVGRYWTQKQLDKVGTGCGAVTTMSQGLAETYARQPGFYGGTYCVGCKMHLPVGQDGEFVWDGTQERVGS